MGSSAHRTKGAMSRCATGVVTQTSSLARTSMRSIDTCSADIYTSADGCCKSMRLRAGRFCSPSRLIGSVVMASAVRPGRIVMSTSQGEKNLDFQICTTHTPHSSSPIRPTNPLPLPVSGGGFWKPLRCIAVTVSLIMPNTSQRRLLKRSLLWRRTVDGEGAQGSRGSTFLQPKHNYL